MPNGFASHCEYDFAMNFLRAMNTSRRPRPFGVLVFILALAGCACAQPLPVFDFTKLADSAGWAPSHDISALTTTTTGLLVRISGGDPFTIGPQRDYPAGVPLWLRLKLSSDAGGSCQAFYFSNGASEAASMRFTVPASQWTEGRVAIPALGPGYRIRVDPPGTSGTATLGSLSFEVRTDYPDFDLTTVPNATGWIAQHDIASLTPTLDGLQIAISGSDPYLAGPARNYPAGKLLWLHVRLKSEQSGTAQIFYYQTGPTEGNSVHFYVPAGVWHEAVVPMPALGNGWKLRFDPPGGGGPCTLARIWFDERVVYPPPVWPVPPLPVINSNAFRLTSGELELSHNPEALGAFRLSFAGQPLAAGNPSALLGYALGNESRWLPFGNSPTQTVTAQSLSNGFVLRAAAMDADGARWQIDQQFTTNAPNAIDVETRVSTDRERHLLYLPAFTLLSGAGTHGTNKSQGLLAGLEYLENEPSRSELDAIGDAARRLVPDGKKVTMPLMAVAASNLCLGLIWEPQPDVAPVFDSPDRQFKSGGHLMGLLCPGSDGFNRDEGSLLPYAARVLHPNEMLTVRCTIIADHGNTVIPAVQQYVSLRGLPPLPAALTASNYFRNTAHAWLDSGIRSNGLIRHAVWPGFGAQPAADAAVWMKWLAEQVTEPALMTELSEVAATVLAQIPNPALYNTYGVSHVRYPLPALIFGAVLQNASQAKTDAQGLLGRFQPDGSVLYVAPSGGPDLGSTHYAPDANGLTADAVLWLLDKALFSGDRSLIDIALRQLRAMAKFRDTVPRGAQTWEVPLHTPDILASAYLVMAHLRGYQITGEAKFLEEARYWAWTGVPFVYLTPPVPAAVGLYATIPVFGSTQWVGPWFGRPVQWCGLVYAEALYQLALEDPISPWRQIADGIAASGTQQSFPPGDVVRQGLLPDFYLLQEQVSDGPAINPGTLQSQAAQFYTGTRAYSFSVVREHGLYLHAPGSLGEIKQTSDAVEFTVTNWASSQTRVLLGGFTGVPGVVIEGTNVPIAWPHQFDAARGLLVLGVQGTNRVRILHPALPRLEIKAAITNGAVELSWPAANSNFVLERAAVLPSIDGWSNSTAPVRVAGDRRIATEPTSSSSRFFRLRRTP
jgi:hypothetical protein